MNNQLEVLKTSFNSNKTKSYEWRMSQLSSCLKGLEIESDNIVEVN